MDAREAKCVKFPESQIYAVNLYGLSKIETPPKPEAPDLSGIDPDEIEPGEEIPDRGYDLHVDNIYVENGEDHLKRNTYLTEGNLYITNGSLKIDGNLQLYKTKVIMPEGKLQVSENLELCKSQIVMTEGRLQVDGDLINNSSTVGYNSGDIHIKGRTEQREGSIYFYDNCRLEFDQDVEFPDGGNFNLYGDSVTCIFHGNFNQGSSGFFMLEKEISILKKTIYLGETMDTDIFNIQNLTKTARFISVEIKHKKSNCVMRRLHIGEVWIFVKAKMFGLIMK